MVVAGGVAAAAPRVDTKAIEVAAHGT